MSDLNDITSTRALERDSPTRFVNHAPVLW